MQIVREQGRRHGRAGGTRAERRATGKSRATPGPGPSSTRRCRIGPHTVRARRARSHTAERWTRRPNIQTKKYIAPATRAPRIACAQLTPRCALHWRGKGHARPARTDGRTVSRPRRTTEFYDSGSGFSRENTVSCTAYAATDGGIALASASLSAGGNVGSTQSGVGNSFDARNSRLNILDA